MNTKIRIDLTQGIIEAEGNEDFVKTIYNDFKERLDSPKSFKPKSTQTLPSKTPSKTRSKPSVENKKESTPKRNVLKSNTKMVKDLDLSGRDCKSSLKDFYAQYKVKSNFEKNLIFLYYLKNVMNEEEVGIDHIFTCYRNLNGIKIPGNLEQSIRDTRTKKSWIDYKKIEDLSLTVHGINYVEHDIKKRD